MSSTPEVVYSVGGGRRLFAISDLRFELGLQRRDHGPLDALQLSRAKVNVHPLEPNDAPLKIHHVLDYSAGNGWYSRDLMGGGNLMDVRAVGGLGGPCLGFHIGGGVQGTGGKILRQGRARLTFFKHGYSLGQRPLWQR
jgi:hypothetical protein